jgi:hypothetical protein
MENRKLLRCIDFANKYLEIESSKFYTLDSKIKIIGWYKLIEEIVSALFVDELKLFMLWDNLKYHITDTCVVKLNVLEHGKTKRFLLYDSNNLIFDFIYELKDNYASSTSFDYLDDEDFDWGLFVSNIINNQKRKENFTMSLSE